MGCRILITAHNPFVIQAAVSCCVGARTSRLSPVEPRRKKRRMKPRVNAANDLDDAGSDTSSVYKPLRRHEQVRPHQQRYEHAHVPQPPEREGRSSRIRQENRRTIAPRQEAIIRDILTQSGCCMKNKWKNKDEPYHVSALKPCAAVPSASSQRWCRTMQQVRRYTVRCCD